VTRPPVPEPWTVLRSRPCSSAMRRATGEACARSSTGAGEAAAGAAAAALVAGSSNASTSPGCTVSPSRWSMRPSTPDASAGTADVAQLTLAHDQFEARPEKIPGAHVLRFFLEPDNFARLAVGIQQFG